MIHSDESAGGTRPRDRRDRLGVSHIDGVDDSSAFHRAVAPIVGLLRRNGFTFVESKGVMVGEVGACDGDGLGVDLGVQAWELARMTFKCARVGGDLGRVLVLHDALECTANVLYR